jgi:hypothetical protein
MIIATKKGNDVTVRLSICDSSANMTEKDLALTDNIPLWRVKGEKDCYVCCEDNTYSSDILRFNDYVFKGVTDGKSIIENVIPKMKDLLGRHDRLLNGKEWLNQMLIIKGDKVYKIGNYFTVFEIDDYAVLGYESFVIGALDETRDKDATESILESLRNMNRMKNRQFFPITIFDTSSKKKKVYFS